MIYCLVTKQFYVLLSDQTVSNMFEWTKLNGFIMFDQVFVIGIILPNTIKQIKQSAQTGKRLVPKRGLIVSDRPTFPVWTGLISETE